MLKRIATATVVICLVGLARLGVAQSSSDQFRPFNGLFADLFDDGSQPQRPQRPVQNNPTYNYNSPATTQLQRTPTRASQPQLAPQPDSDLLSHPDPAATRSRHSITGSNYSFQYDDGSSPN